MGNSPITARINALLAEKGISKMVFYRDCNITSASYSLWNTGKTMPRMKNLETIADYLHTTTDYLLTGLGEKEKPPANEGMREISKDELKLALWCDVTDITDDDLEEVLRYAEFIRERKKRSR